MLISGSLLAVKNEFFDYASLLKQFGVNYLHVDLFGADDGVFKFRDILQFDGSYLPLDIHLIYPRIDAAMIDVLNDSTAHFLSLQYENLENPAETLMLAKRFKGNVGLAITSNTSLAQIEPFIHELQYILVMCSEPGVSGAKFQMSSYNLIDLIHARFPTLDIFADGGIESGIAKMMSGHGVKLIVSGSFLAKNTANIDSTVYNLKFGGESNIPIVRKMIKPFLLPTIGMDVGFFDIIDTINKARLGICFVLDGSHLEGLISDGDIRRAYLKYGRDIFDISSADVVNREYFRADEHITVEELYRQLSGQDKPITIVPIISDGMFAGAVSLR
jgi:ribulose-phosphate 3-epimerase